MDFLYKQYFKTMQYIYDKYSGKLVLPGSRNFMSHKELSQMIKDTELNEKVPNQEIPLLFNISMMTEIDELSVDNCLEMEFVEFLECFARLADKVSLPKYGLKQPE